ncbi:MAG TPA: hypothetical protein P5210_00610 [Draconibacterium sp.]|nr:hypothetical protein [Draconibacterium sp.]
MFFVGATGQILTLILTVCLPFVFLFSAEPQSNILTETLQFENVQIRQEVVLEVNNTHYVHFDSIEKLQNIFTEFENSVIQIVHSKNIREKWKSPFFANSGNKAPPVFNFLPC